MSFVDSINSRLGRQFDEQLKLRRPDAKIFHFYNDHIGSDAGPSEVLPQVKNADTVGVAAFVTHVPGRQVLAKIRAEYSRPFQSVHLRSLVKKDRERRGAARFMALQRNRASELRAN